MSKVVRGHALNKFDFFHDFNFPTCVRRTCVETQRHTNLDNCFFSPKFDGLVAVTVTVYILECKFKSA